MCSRRNLFLVLFFAILLAKACNNSSETYHKSQAGKAGVGRFFKPSVWPDRIIQSVSGEPATQINLSWRASSEINEGYVEFHPLVASIIANTEYQIEMAEKHVVQYQNVHDQYFKATLSGLEPDKKYNVRVGCENYRSEWFTVRTSPVNFEPFHFLYFGDMQNEIREYGTRVFRHAATNNPNARFILHAGDLVLSSGNDDTWAEWFHAGGWLFQQVPSAVVAGNSDHLRWQREPTDQRLLFPQWHGIFHLPKNGPEGFENLVYYFDYPGVRVVSLYSNFESMDGNNREIYIREGFMITDELFQQQVNWLEEVLAANQQPWLVVLMHHPVFSSKEGRVSDLMKSYFLPLFENYSVDLVLQGHDHVYARGHNPDSENNSELPVYVISVAGGKMNEVDPSRSWIEQSIENKQLYHVIRIDQNSLQFDAIDVKGQIADSFFIEARPDGSKKRGNHHPK